MSENPDMGHPAPGIVTGLEPHSGENGARDTLARLILAGDAGLE
jgi:hypothetical protein